VYVFAFARSPTRSSLTHTFFSRATPLSLLLLLLLLFGASATSNNYESKSSDGNGNSDHRNRGFSSQWTAAIDYLRIPILKAMQAITRFSALNPKSTIAGVVFFSIGIFVLGLFTNFSVDVNEDTLWTPKGANPAKQMKVCCCCERNILRLRAPCFYSPGASLWFYIPTPAYHSSKPRLTPPSRLCLFCLYLQIYITS
jgi:hypothetical protein